MSTAEERVKELEEQLKQKDTALDSANKRADEATKTSATLAKSVASGGYNKQLGVVREIGFKGSKGESKDVPRLFEVTNGVGDLPVTQDVCRALQQLGLVPPLSLLDDQVIAQVNSNHTEFLPLIYREKDVTACRSSYALFHELDHHLPPTKFFPALQKLANLVIAIFASDDSKASVFLKTDFLRFISDLATRMGGEGSFRFVREYAIKRLRSWALGIEASVDWDKNVLSDFNEKIWSDAVVAAGGRGDLDLIFKDEIAGDAPTYWGSMVKVAVSGASTALERLKKITAEDRKFAGKVFAGRQPDGQIPPSSNFSYPWVQKEPSSGPSRSTKQNGKTSDALYTKVKQEEKENFSRTTKDDFGGGGDDSFRCICCGKDGHRYSDCKDICAELELVNGKELKHSNPDPDKDKPRKYLCRRFNLGRCNQSAAKCHNFHGCARCGAAGHSSLACPKQA